MAQSGLWLNVCFGSKSDINADLRRAGGLAEELAGAVSDLAYVFADKAF